MSTQEEQVSPGVEGAEQQEAKKVSKKFEPGVEPLDEIRQRAVSAYTAYVEAERQVEKAYKEQELQAEQNYNESKQKARKICEESIAQTLRIRDEAEQRATKACEGSIAQALKIREEAEQKAWEVRNEVVERTWVIFTTSRK